VQPHREADISVSPGVSPSYDAKVTREEEFTVSDDDEPHEISKVVNVFDLNTSVIVGIIDPGELREIGDIGYGHATRIQKKFCKQVDALFGAGNDGFNILSALPFIALARRTIREVVGSEDFSVPFAMDHWGKLEMRPIYESKTLPRPIVNIDHIDGGELEYIQDRRRRTLRLAGEGIIKGKPFVLDNPYTSEPVPDGAIVLIDDEFHLGATSPSILAPAAAIITRGYIGKRGLHVGGGHNHFEIIGRALAEERPGEFVFFTVPHINPDTEEMRQWHDLRNGPLIVASNGRDVKLTRDRS
jgi:hypothetical protein